MPAHRQVIAIMYTDRAGSTVDAQRNEALALKVRERHDLIVEGVIRKFAGTIVSKPGDGFVVHFASVLGAWECAEHIQLVLADYNRATRESDRILVRIGLHVGDVVRDGKDLAGDTMNVASRFESQADPGGICISRAVFDQIQNKTGYQFERLPPRALKGVAEPVELYRVRFTPTSARESPQPSTSLRETEPGKGGPKEAGGVSGGHPAEQSRPFPPDVTVYRRFADVPIDDYISQARQDVRIFGVSGRNIFTPNIRAIIKRKIQDSFDLCRIRVLIANERSPSRFVTHRQEMMPPAGTKVDYGADVRNSRTIMREISELDPKHKRFDVRQYDLLPTAFFIFADSRLVVSHLLATAVAEAPALELDTRLNPYASSVFSDHFETYWNRCTFFASVVAFSRDSSEFMMVFNRERRGWELPGGFIEAGERPIEAAKREFEEETRYTVDGLKELATSSGGVYFVGTLGKPRPTLTNPAEIAHAQTWKTLPGTGTLSYPNEEGAVTEMVERARQLHRVRTGGTAGPPPAP